MPGLGGHCQHRLSASDPAPCPGRKKRGISCRSCEGREGTFRSDCPATLTSRLPCAVKVPALSASLFLGPWLPAPFALSAPYSDFIQTLNIPLSSRAVGPFPGRPRRSPQDFPSAADYAVCSRTNSQGGLSHQPPGPSTQLCCDCPRSLHPARGLPPASPHHFQRRRLWGRETRVQLLPTFLCAPDFVPGCFQSSGLGSLSALRIREAVPAPRSPQRGFLPPNKGLF